MNLREMIIERIHYAVDEYTLREEFSLETKEVAELSDLDLLELYEDVVGFRG